MRRFNAQTAVVAKALLPKKVTETLSTRLGRYGIAVVLARRRHRHHPGDDRPSDRQRIAARRASVVNRTIGVVFFVFAVVTGIVCWFYVLAHDSRLVAEEESSRQNTLLLKEIAAHKKTDAALQYAKETAEAANRAKSRYVVGLSHELRTPLNAVLGYAQILERDETIPAPRQSAIKVIKRSADHLSGLIDGLLDISKIEAGRLQVYSNEINIQDFLDQVADMFRPQAQAKGLVFEHERASALPQYVRTDEKRLRQILVNLLSNAIKFTDTGTIRFDVAYRSQVATFTVSDTGRGISQADLPRIFEPFQRGEAERVRPMPGLGLGLTITRLLTQTLGGEIVVDSERDKGSTFRVRLMLSAIDRPTASLPSVRKIAGYAGPRRTIVVVDDNEDHRELMREVLMPLDFVVLTAAGGTECLTLIEGVQAGSLPDRHFDARHERLATGHASARARTDGAGHHAFGQYRRRHGRPMPIPATTILSPSPSISASCTTSWPSIWRSNGTIAIPLQPPPKPQVKAEVRTPGVCPCRGTDPAGRDRLCPRHRGEARRSRAASRKTSRLPKLSRPMSRLSTLPATRTSSQSINKQGRAAGE